VTYPQNINVIAPRQRKGKKKGHPVCQILRCENSTKTLLIVNNEDTVGALGSTQLTSLGYRDVLWHGKCGAGLESGDGSLCRSSLSRAFGGAALVCGYGAFTGELGFDFLPNCLGWVEGSVKK